MENKWTRIEAIRQPTCRECGVTTGGGEFCYQHAPYFVWPLKDGSFRSDRNGMTHIWLTAPPTSDRDTRDAALRALVEQWKAESAELCAAAMATATDSAGVLGKAAALRVAAGDVSRLLEHEP